MNYQVVADSIRSSVEQRFSERFAMPPGGMAPIEAVLNVVVEASEARDKRIAWRITEALERQVLMPEVIEAIILASGLVTGEPTTAWPAPVDAEQVVPIRPGTFPLRPAARLVADQGDDDLTEAVTCLRAAAVAITNAAESLAKLLP